MTKISVALATFNEEKNIKDCLESVKELASEIIVVDGNSADRTAEIAKSFGAKVVQVPNDPMFHNMKQRAFDLSSGEWILYLDADERVSSELAEEIRKVTNMSNDEIEKYQHVLKSRDLFLRHQKLLEKRDGLIGTDNGIYAAFFFPRLNYFLGKYLRFGGVYPDGVIRLFKRGKAYLPCQNVHEQMVVDGLVGWLQHDLLHFSDPTFTRYLQRNSRYINLIAVELKKDKIGKNPIQFLNFFFLKPLGWFFLTQLRHKGILDGYQGVVFSLFSALRFPRAFWRYMNENRI